MRPGPMGDFGPDITPLSDCLMDWANRNPANEDNVFEVRLHGRGGQGIVTMAELLALAAFNDGHEAQAFPSFGSERTGAPVMSFCRIADKPIRLREPVLEPDALVIADPTLLHHVDVFAGLKPTGYVLLNSTRTVEELGIGEIVDQLLPGRIRTIAATDLAREYVGRPLPSGPLLGAVAAFIGLTSLDAIANSFRDCFSETVAEANIRAAHAGFDAMHHELETTNA